MPVFRAENGGLLSNLSGRHRLSSGCCTSVGLGQAQMKYSKAAGLADQAHERIVAGERLGDRIEEPRESRVAADPSLSAARVPQLAPSSMNPGGLELAPSVISSRATSLEAARCRARARGRACAAGAPGVGCSAALDCRVDGVACWPDMSVPREAAAGNKLTRMISAFDDGCPRDALVRRIPGISTPPAHARSAL